MAFEQQLGPTDPTEPQVLPLRTEMRAEFSAVRRIAGQGTSLRQEIRDQGTQMRVLHEEVISRIALLQEGRFAQPRSPRKK